MDGGYKLFFMKKFYKIYENNYKIYEKIYKMYKI